MENGKENSPAPQKRVEQTVTLAEFHGPIPPAEQLHGYETICPGAADRIIRMAEKQSAHRQEIERLIVSGRKRDSLYGILGAIFLTIAVLVGGVICILAGHDTAGATIIGIDIIGLCTVFIRGTSLKQNSTNKNE